RRHTTPSGFHSLSVTAPPIYARGHTPRPRATATPQPATGPTTCRRRRRPFNELEEVARPESEIATTAALAHRKAVESTGTAFAVVSPGCLDQIAKSRETLSPAARLRLVGEFQRRCCRDNTAGSFTADFEVLRLVISSLDTAIRTFGPSE
ncbi:unnamed protein product, partial [Ixodes persulcatus]